MRDGVGPASYANREDIPEYTIEGIPSIVPMRLMPQTTIEARDPDPRGMVVVGADGTVAGTVKDVWVDRAEALIRYLEVDVATPAGTRSVLLPMTMARVSGRSRQVSVKSILAAQFANVPAYRAHRSRHQARRGSDRRLLRRRHALRHAATAGTRAMTASAATRYNLPEPLPAGEEVIWQGKPEWRALALHAFHARKIALYFGILALWRVASAFVDGDAATSAAISMLWLLLLGCAAVGVLTLMAWLSSRATTYTITS